MPKFGVHHVVLADATEQRLLLSQNKGVKKAGEVLAANKAAAMLGAVGPDLFFFSPDYESMKLITRFYLNVDRALTFYDEIMTPIHTINEKVVDPAQKFVKDLGGETVALIESNLNKVKEAAGLFKSAIQSTLFAGVLTGVDTIVDTAFPKASTIFFDKFFTPGVQRNERVNHWFWFDVLHYRQTGEFARNLVASARTPAERAYAYGYLSHIATDVVGHPYVNQVVGAPYRLNVQRHVTVENFIDCWKFNKDFGESINATLLTRLGLTKTLPDELAVLMHTAFKKTYTSALRRPLRVNLDKPGEEGFLTVQQIHETYETFVQIMRIMQKMSVRRPEEPFKGAAEILNKAIADFLEKPPAPPSAPAKSCGWKDILGFTAKTKACYSSFFKNITGYLQYFGQILAYTIETMLDLCDLIIAAFLAMPALVLLAILYGVQLLVYEVYRMMHSVLALVGFVYPEPDDLKTSNGLALTTPILDCGEPRTYPRIRDLEASHLVCPTGKVEEQINVADFNPPSPEVTPDQFIKDREFKVENFLAYATSPTPAQTGKVQNTRAHLGNATSFTEFMIALAAHPNVSEKDKNLVFTNWNLDSDRGHGYKVWSGKIQTKNDPMDVADEKFIA
jgi:hypothetical protein